MYIYLYIYIQCKIESQANALIVDIFTIIRFQLDKIFRCKSTF